MELEEQVCSLELATRLKELGVEQESLFQWMQTYTRKSGEYKRDSRWYLQKTPKGRVYESALAAFTVAELGEMLPSECNTGKTVGLGRDHGRFVCCYDTPDSEGQMHYFLGHGEYADTEADARAKMLIYLLQNETISMTGE